MKKKILIHSIAFSPDAVSTAYLYNDIALRLQKEGFNVVVLTTTPHYNIVKEETVKQPLRRRMLGLFYVSDFNGIKVFHVPQKKFKNSLLRIAGFLYWHIMSIIIGLTIKNIFCILTPSPPISVGVVSVLIARLKGAKSIYNVQEVYPDILVNHGVLTNKILISFFKRVEKWVYHYSDRIIVIDEVFHKLISSRVTSINKLEIIPNFVDTKIFKPVSEVGFELNEKLFPNNSKLKIMYAGNIGIAQDWLPLISIAKTLEKMPIEFYIIGEGVSKASLKEASKELTNIKIIPYQNRHLMPNIIGYADLHFIFMNPKIDFFGLPSKIFSIMACGKPLLIMTQEKTPLANFFKEYDCAKIITQRDFQEKVREGVSFIQVMARNREKMKKMGRSSLNIVLENYTSDIVTNKYFKLVSEIHERNIFK